MGYVKKKKTTAKPVANENVIVAKLQRKVGKLESLLDTVVDKLRTFYMAFCAVFGVLAFGSFVTMMGLAVYFGGNSEPHGFFIFTAVVATFAIPLGLTLLAKLMNDQDDDLLKKHSKLSDEEDEEE